MDVAGRRQRRVWAQPVHAPLLEAQASLGGAGPEADQDYTDQHMARDSGTRGIAGLGFSSPEVT